MFCEKCGKENPNGAKFCEGCGADIQPTDATSFTSEDFVGNAINNVKNNDVVKKILPIGILVVAIIIVVAVLNAAGVFKSAPVKAYENYFKAVVKGDGKAVFKAEIDPFELENKLDNEVWDDEEDAIEEYMDDAEDRVDALEDKYGDKLKVKFEDVKVSKKYDKKEIKKLAEYLEDEYDYDANALQDIKIVKGKVTIKGSDDDERDTEEMVVAKIKGKWYVGRVGDLYDKDSIKDALKADKED